MLNSGDPMILEVYKQSTGEVLLYKDCISINNITDGTRKIKILASGQIRSLRDCCIRSINGMLVYL